MNTIICIILTAITTLDTTIAEYNTSKLEPGLLFEPMADIELINGHWKFITNINLTSFYDELEYITEIINKTKEQCHTSQVLSHHHNNNFCDGLTIQLTEDLEEIKDTNKYFLHNRQRRGLLNIVGHGLKFLFGTMDANDAQYYENEFKKIETRGYKTQTDLQQQKTYLQSTITKLNETDVLLNQHSSILQSLDNELETFKQYIQNESYYNQANSMFIQLINYASSLLSKIRRDQNKLFDIIFSSRQGMIHDSLLNPTEALQEINRIRIHMINQQFPFSAEPSNLYNIINIGQFTAVQFNNIIIFEIKIPLYQPTYFKIYNIVTIPKIEENNTFSFITPEYTHLVTNKETNLYFPMDPSALSTDCKIIQNKKYLCKTPDQTYKTHTRMNCEMSIFTHTTHQCPETKRRITDAIWVWLFQPNKFLYILPEKTSVTVKCETEDTIQLNGVGILTTNGCSIETSKMILYGFNDTSTIFDSNIRKTNHIYLPFLYQPQPNMTWMSPGFSSLKSIKLLEEDKFKFEEPTIDTTTDFQTAIIITIIIILSALSSLCYFAFWLWFKGIQHARQLNNSTP